MNLVEDYERQEEESAKPASKRRSDIKFVQENGEPLSEAEESPKSKKGVKTKRRSKETSPDTSPSPSGGRDRRSVDYSGDMSDSKDEGEEEYEVERILDVKKKGRSSVYLVKWKGWDNVEDQTWEPESSLAGSRDLLREFNQQREAKIGSDSKTPNKRGRKSVTKDDDSTPMVMINLEDSEDDKEDEEPKPKKAKKKTKTPKKGGKKTKKVDEEEEDDEYEVEKIVEKRQIGRQVMYKVKWKGWEREEDLTWEPASNLVGSEELITEFEDNMTKDDDEEDGVKLCEVCQRIFISPEALSKHLKSHKVTSAV